MVKLFDTLLIYVKTAEQSQYVYGADISIIGDSV